jgi:hypothetical protein
MKLMILLILSVLKAATFAFTATCSCFPEGTDSPEVPD